MANELRVPPLSGTEPEKNENNEGDTIREYLMIILEHDLDAGVTSVGFEGQNVDADNDEIVIDILNTAASIYDYTLVPDEEIAYTDVE